MKVYTPDDILALKPCGSPDSGIIKGPYNIEHIRSLIGDGATLPEMFRITRVPHANRMWLACKLMTPDQRRSFANIVTERAIRRILGRSGVPEWENWATRWLSGEDRSVVEAKKVVSAARAVSVYEAAWAARAAWVSKMECPPEETMGNTLWISEEAQCWSAKAEEREREQSTERKLQEADIICIVEKGEC